MTLERRAACRSGYGSPCARATACTKGQATEEEFKTLRTAGVIDEDVVSAAQDAIRLERMKRLLL